MKRSPRSRTPGSSSRTSEHGYVLITLILFVALLAIGLTVLAPEMIQQMKREREAELIHRGTQYSRAIKAYQKKFSRYPTRIEDLENTNNVHFLRKRYKDPITGKDFKLLHMGDTQLANGPALQGATSAANLAAGSAGGNSSPFGGSGVFGGGPTGNSGGAFGGNSGGAFGGNSGGAFGGNSGGAFGGNSGGAFGGNSGGAFGGNSGGAFGGNSGGAFGGNSGGAFGGNSGGAFGGNSGGAFGNNPPPAGTPPNANPGAGSDDAPPTAGAPGSQGGFGQSVQQLPGFNQQGSGNQVFGGGPIVGVASTSKDKSIRVFGKLKHYNEWQFIYDPTTDRGGLITTPAQPLQTATGNLGGTPGGAGTQGGSDKPFGSGVGPQNPPGGLTPTPQQSPYPQMPPEQSPQ